MASTVQWRRNEAKKALEEYASRQTLATIAVRSLQLVAGHDALAATPTMSTKRVHRNAHDSFHIIGTWRRKTRGNRVLPTLSAPSCRTGATAIPARMPHRSIASSAPQAYPGRCNATDKTVAAILIVRPANGSARHYLQPARVDRATEHGSRTVGQRDLRPTPFLHGCRSKLTGQKPARREQLSQQAMPVTFLPHAAGSGRQSRGKVNGSTNFKLYGIVHARSLTVSRCLRPDHAQGLSPGPKALGAVVCST